MTDPALNENYRNVFDAVSGFGARPAAVVVDFIRAYTTQGSPLYAPAVIDAIRETGPLLDAARDRGGPVIFTRVAYHPTGMDGGIFVRRGPALRKLVAAEPAGGSRP